MKNTDPVANTKIYLATSFFNEEQRARIPQALAQLEANPTVGVVHQPFDFQYKDARVDSDPAGVFGGLLHRAGLCADQEKVFLSGRAAGVCRTPEAVRLDSSHGPAVK